MVTSDRLLWAAIEHMATTLEKPDPRIWQHLLVYVPIEEIQKRLLRKVTEGAA